MDPHQRHVMTIANSIIGVSILAMPFCFKQCGIILSIVLLCVSSIISRLSCHFLLKSAIISRLRTFEFLAYHAFGFFGKFIVEIGLIGFLMGTCIAFFVVMGELAPGIVAEITNSQATSTLRNLILIMLAVFCVLPLGLLRKVDSLSGVCTATIGFYITLVLKVIFESLPHIYQGDWIDKVEYWKPSGILQCLPIFSMALFCQTQLFEIYQAIPNASLEKMNGLIRVAVNICTSVYILVGVFGYIALSHQTSFTGNILLSFQPSIVTDVMKIGFVLSIAFSFPLIIFPCRASLYSLLYKRVHDASNNYIPERKFKILTVTIVVASLLVGVLIPNIELVLGLVGSTIGVMICVIFPATCFICILSKNTNERLLAQVMLFTGIIVMVLGTYANLYAFEEVAHTTEKSNILIKFNEKEHELLIARPPSTIKTLIKLDEEPKQIRHEPPQPVEPVDVPIVIKEAYKVEDAPAKEIVTEKLLKDDALNVSQKSLIIQDDKQQNNKVDEVDVEAIKKEDKEIREDEKLNEDKGKELLKNEVNAKLDHFQKQINELKINQQKESKVNEKKLKTFKEIELLARKAIETLTNNKKVDDTISKNDDVNMQQTPELKEINAANVQVAAAASPGVADSENNKAEQVIAKQEVAAVKNAKRTVESDRIVETQAANNNVVLTPDKVPAELQKSHVKLQKNVAELQKDAAELQKDGVPLQKGGVKMEKDDIELKKVVAKLELNQINKIELGVKAINLSEKKIVNSENALFKAQPLSYQLGLNNKNVNNDAKAYVKGMLPIPLAGTNYSKILLKNNDMDNERIIPPDQMNSDNLLKTNEQTKEQKPSMKVEEQNKIADDVQSIRRDILSNDRQKRETISEIKLDEHCEKKPSKDNPEQLL